MRKIMDKKISKPKKYDAATQWLIKNESKARQEIEMEKAFPVPWDDMDDD